VVVVDNTKKQDQSEPTSGSNVSTKPIPGYSLKGSILYYNGLPYTSDSYPFSAYQGSM